MTQPRLQRWALASIDWYQRGVDGRPSPCRFTPSCSSYAYEAIDLHGTVHGGLLAMRRLLRCRPFGPSGFDPVPERAEPGSDPRPGVTGTVRASDLTLEDC